MDGGTDFKELPGFVKLYLTFLEYTSLHSITFRHFLTKSLNLLSKESMTSFTLSVFNTLRIFLIVILLLCTDVFRASTDLFLYLSFMSYDWWHSKIYNCVQSQTLSPSPSLVLLCSVSLHEAGINDEKTWHLFEIREKAKWIKML